MKNRIFILYGFNMVYGLGIILDIIGRVFYNSHPDGMNTLGFIVSYAAIIIIDEIKTHK